MIRVISCLILAGLICLGSSCRPAASCGMQKTNSKLIAGNHDFGKKKEAQHYKRKNRSRY